MYKKSELYSLFMQEFFENQQSDSNLLRIKSLGDDKKEIVNIAQQAATESATEIMLNILGKLGIIEDDCKLDSNYRYQVTMQTVDTLRNSTNK